MATISKEDFHKHLDILQGIISRMAANSATCKNYCITLSAALLALDQFKQQEKLVWITLLPILLFAFLDTYYLSLERYFKKQFKVVVKKWQEDSLERSDIYHIEPSSKKISRIFPAFLSYSIWPFYGSLLLLVLVLISDGSLCFM